MPYDLGGFFISHSANWGQEHQCKDMGGLLKYSFFVPVVYGHFSFETQCSIFLNSYLSRACSEYSGNLVAGRGEASLKYDL